LLQQQQQWQQLKQSLHQQKPFQIAEEYLWLFSITFGYFLLFHLKLFSAIEGYFTLCYY